MKRQGRILIIDDQVRWQKMLSTTLQRTGFQVTVASDPKTARERLQEHFYHLIVLDIRMEDKDPTNTQGFELLREWHDQGLTDASAIVMLSAYGTSEQMREAFRERRINDFLEKQKFVNTEFAAQVQAIFEQDLNINLDLTIHWQHIANADEAVFNLKIDETRVKRGSSLQQVLASELDDLLCRLFSEAHSLLVRPLTPGKSGARILLIQPFYTSGGAQSVIVKFGDAQQIDMEYHRFQKYVQPFIGGGRSTTIRNMRRTRKLGGIVYSLLGVTGDRLEDFGSFYHHTALPEITQMLDRLFHDTCGAWYANPGQLQPLNLTDDYQRLLEFKITTDSLQRVLSEQLKSVQGKQKLYFTSLPDNRAFTNPILAIDTSSFVCPTYVCPTHGDFNEQNILVDTAHQAWLIDFLRTGEGHILRDVAELDSVVRFHLLSEDDATLQERLSMEEALCSITRFSEVEQLSERLHIDNAVLAKSYAVVVHLRLQARKLVMQNPGDDIREYFIALFYYALNTARFSWLSKTQREHALLSASLLADHLNS